MISDAQLGVSPPQRCCTLQSNNVIDLAGDFTLTPSYNVIIFVKQYIWQIVYSSVVQKYIVPEIIINMLCVPIKARRLLSIETCCQIQSKAVSLKQ